MNRVFLDANVLFSAAYLPRSGLRALWRSPDAIIMTSALAAEEARRNLTGPAQRRRLESLLRRTIVREGAPRPDDAARPSHGLPEKDRPILWAAIDLQATHLITGDRTHFGHLFGKTIGDMIVMTPRQFLDEQAGRAIDRPQE